MTHSMTQKRNFLVAYAQLAASAVLILGTLAMLAATVAAAFGYLPFLQMPLRFGDVLIPQAGIFVQSGVVLLLCAICAFLPSGFRVLQLERSHRDFAMCMSDVADAYHASHAADRAGAFRLGSEYDAVKERILFLRQHPDLGAAEPQILELASQMSYTSRDLAQIYSDENVSRARGFLRHRQEEIELFEDRIHRARDISHELRDHLGQVEKAEKRNDARLADLESEFGDLLDRLGFRRHDRDGNVIALPSVTAAE